MPLYNKQTTFLVVSGYIFMHMLILGLSSFFVYRFITDGYDSGWIVLILMFMFMLLVVDIQLSKFQIFSRFWVRCDFDSTGICCRCFLKNKWNIAWQNICVFGTIGYTPNTGMGIIFLSCDQNEKYEREKCILISEKRIVFEANQYIWAKLSEFMPSDIRYKLESAIHSGRDCWYRRTAGN